MAQPSGDVTGLLLAWGAGDTRALDELLPLVYSELRRIAHRELRRERAGGTIGTTALVHETYLRLVDQKRTQLESRQHFLGLAAHVMRRVLVDEARRRLAAKRGAGAVRIELEDVAPLRVPADRQLLALDEALDRLEAIDAHLKRVVELRYFGGFTLEQTADLLGISRSSVWRDWQTAKAWLFDTLSSQHEGA